MTANYHNQVLGPGDRCRIVASECIPRDSKHIGAVVCVLSMDSLGHLAREIIRATEAMTGHRNYPIQIEGQPSRPMVICASSLRKLEPPQSKSDWDQVEKLTGWKRPEWMEAVS